MTFNLRMDTVDDGKNAWSHRKEQVLQTIKGHDPDILSIQEGLQHMLAYLRTSLSTYRMIGEGRDGGEEGEYNAIFYKKEVLALKQHGQFWLSETPEVSGSISWGSGCRRICTWGEFACVDNISNTFYAYNTHLDNASQQARKKGSEVIASKLTPILQDHSPALLTGDFNCEPDNEVIKHIEGIGMTRLHIQGKTFHDFLGGIAGRPIDYIFLSGQYEIKEAIIDRCHLNEKYPSDHYPIIAKVNI